MGFSHEDNVVEELSSITNYILRNLEVDGCPSMLRIFLFPKVIYKFIE